MKRMVMGVVSLIGFSLLHAGEVRQCVLDEKKVYEIPVSASVPTTVVFPSKISALNLANVSTDMNANGGILISYQDGMFFFSVRAREKGTFGGVNVLFNRKVYVLTFYESSEPCRSVKFIEGRSQAFRNRVNVTPSHLVSILDKAKCLPLLLKEGSASTAGISFETPYSKTLFKNKEAILEEVIRFEAEDTIVFRIRLKNKTEKDIYYLPQKLAVSVGENVYFSSISDASGVIPAEGESLAYFAITGAPDGGRLNLSAKNNFAVLVEECEDVTLVPAGRGRL